MEDKEEKIEDKEEELLKILTSGIEKSKFGKEWVNFISSMSDNDLENAWKIVASNNEHDKITKIFCYKKISDEQEKRKEDRKNKLNNKRNKS